MFENQKERLSNIEKERNASLREREIQFQVRKDKIERVRYELETKELDSIPIRLNSLQSRLSSHTEKHQGNLKRIQSEAALKNQ